MIHLKTWILLFTLSFTLGSSVSGAPQDTLDHFPNYRIQGGTPTFKNAFIDQIQYPRTALNQGIMGTSLVSLTITPAGTIADFRIITSLGEVVDEALKSVIPQTEKDWLADSLETRDLTFIVAFTFLIDGYTFMRNSKVSSQIVTCEVPIVEYGGTNARIRDDTYHIEHANRLYQGEKYSKAIDHLDELIRRDPFNRELYLMRGFCQFKLNNPDAACRDFQRIRMLLHQSVPHTLEEQCS
ncbi:MAG: energy transducer TonB [Cyclobacteriaceae bacterium]